MSKIKEFINNNKKEIKVLAYGVGMMTFGIFIGAKYERNGMDKIVTELAETGKQAYRIIDNDIYQMTIIKGQPK